MTVEGYYDGNAYVALEQINIKPTQRVRITILDEETAGNETKKTKRLSREEITASVMSFMGKSHSWAGEDAVEYQRRMREERIIG